MTGAAFNPSADRLGGKCVPAELRARAEQHSRHLAELAGSLRAAGIGDALIDLGVRDLIASFDRELDAARIALGGQADG